MVSQLGQLGLQVGTANRQKKPLALLQDLVELGLMFCQTTFQMLEEIRINDELKIPYSNILLDYSSVSNL